MEIEVKLHLVTTITTPAPAALSALFAVRNFQLFPATTLAFLSGRFFLRWRRCSARDDGGFCCPRVFRHEFLMKPKEWRINVSKLCLQRRSMRTNVVKLEIPAAGYILVLKCRTGRNYLHSDNILRDRAVHLIPCLRRKKKRQLKLFLLPTWPIR